MGNPIAWLVGGAAALQGGGTLLDAQAGRAQADAAATVAGFNADASGQQASQAEDAQRRQAREILARQRVAAGEAGIADSGTIRKAQEQSMVEAELDALNIRYGGTIKRQGFMAEQSMAKARGKAITKTGYMRAAGQLLGGSGDVMAARRQYGKA